MSVVEWWSIVVITSHTATSITVLLWHCWHETDGSIGNSFFIIDTRYWFTSYTGRTGIEGAMPHASGIQWWRKKELDSPGHDFPLLEVKVLSSLHCFDTAGWVEERKQLNFISRLHCTYSAVIISNNKCSFSEHEEDNHAEPAYPGSTGQ